MEQTTGSQKPVFTPAGFRVFPFFNTRQAGFLIVLLAVIFYSPSLNNEYALDDGIVIHQNNYVVQGVSGIKKILTSDAYDAFYKRMNAADQLQGGRYRPLPSISYALEQQFIGPYRSGYYMRCEDLDQNKVLDSGLVTYEKFPERWETAYEYNDYVDKNNDGIATSDECYACWDLNKNFKNEKDEDLNIDGVFNEVDCQIYGAKVRHFNNILFYAICCLLLFQLFSRYLFKARQDLAFLSALLFAIQPVHSEVVANVRGRDDIFSLIFIALCFIYAYKYLEQASFRNISLAALSLLAALLSKEYAVALFILLPLSWYVVAKKDMSYFKGIAAPLVTFLLSVAGLILCDLKGLYLWLEPATFYSGCAIAYILVSVFFFRRAMRAREGAALMTGLFAAGIVYLCMRLNAVKLAPGVEDTEILNNPFLLASGQEAFATKIYNLLIYLKLSLFPYPLISDYSYASIAYRNLGDWDFILSLLINGTLFITALVLCVKRQILGFALVTYYLFVLLVSNLVFFTGTMMLESYLFHSSIGMCIALASCFLWATEKVFVKSPSLTRTGMVLFLCLVICACGSLAWTRSRDWKNDVTLFFKDVEKQPNSVLILGNAGARWIDLADTKEITGLKLPGTDTTRFNDYNGTLRITEEEMKAGGYQDKRQAALYKGIDYLQRAVKLHPRYVNGFLNLGLAYFKLGDYDKAIYNWKYAEYLYPHNPYLLNYYYVVGNILKEQGAKAFNNEDYENALIAYKRVTVITPHDGRGWHLLGGVYFNMGNKEEAARCFSKALGYEPSNEEFRNVYNVLPDDLKKKYPPEKPRSKTRDNHQVKKQGC